VPRDELSDGPLAHLRHRLRPLSRALLAKIEAYRTQRSWTLPSYSSYGSDFNYHFQVTLDQSGPRMHSPAAGALTSSKPPLQHGRNNSGPVEHRPPGPAAGPPSYSDPKIINCSAAQPLSRVSHPSA
jgi:Bacterial protein of unknown function (DUF899)